MICIFTYASEKLCLGVVTPANQVHLEINFDEQKHEPITFLSTGPKDASENWKAFENEAFVMFKTFGKLDSFFWGRQDLSAFKNHRKLLFFFAPLVLELFLGLHIVSEFLQHAVHL